MSDHGTNIGWTHAEGYKGETWNPTTGCSIVSTECKHCYAMELSLRRGWSQLPWLPEHAAENVVLHPERLEKPLHWREPRMVFVNSMSDLFHERIPWGFIDEVYDVMRRCPQHIFQVLTKRPDRAQAYHKGRVLPEHHRPGDLPNVWLGTSIGLRQFVHRADLLRDTPAAVRFISAEPLLGPLVVEDRIQVWVQNGVAGWAPERNRPFAPELNLDGIDWLIVGGESGKDYRTMDLQWARDLRDACGMGSRWFVEGPAFFMKQDSGPRPGQRGRIPDDLWIHEWPAVQQRPAGALF